MAWSRDDALTLGALLAGNVFFGSLSVAMKLALVHAHALSIAAARVVLAGLVLFAWGMVARRERVAGRDLVKLAGLAVLGVVVNQVLFVTGLQFTGATTATVLIASIPVFTLLVALALGAEVVTRRKAIGVAVSLSGVLVLLGAEAIRGVTTSLLGDILILVNALSYSIYLVLVRPLLARYSSGTVVAWTFLFGSGFIVLVAAPTLLRTPWTTLPTDFWASLLYIVLFGTIATYALSNWVLKRVHASTVAAWVYIQPLVAAVLAATILDEAITPRVVAGGVLIVAGVVVVTRRAAEGDVEGAASLQHPRPPRAWRR